MYNNNNMSVLLSVCLCVQPKFCVKAHVRGEFIIHSGVSGDTAICCFNLSREQPPQSSTKVCVDV